MPLLRAVEVFRTGRDTVSALHIAAFLVVATKAPLRVKDLANALEVCPSTASTVLSRLVEEEYSHQSVGQPLGLVALEPHPEDGRAKVVSLTAKGRHVVLALRDALGARA